MIGTSFSHYQIVAKVGAGGMGEVYRARDSRLGREVALKLIPSEFLTDGSRLRRFEQEARTLAGLNHPNILVIHDVGVHEGTPYLVSELLEGQTLRELLGTGPIPQRRAVDLALQIAHGLAAAHAKGVIHRDLKPENIFVTKDGRAKILDFGLAKGNLLEPQLANPPSPSARTESPTIMESTLVGMVLGTVGYMSPEQVRGEATDHRSDLFTFGCILYEMLSGQRAFRRETTVETMTAVLRDDTPELRASIPDLPLGLERIVRRCLEKSPEERFQSARDLAFALASLSDSGFQVPSLTHVNQSRGSRRRHVALISGTALLLLGGSWFAWKTMTPTARPDAPQQAELAKPPEESRRRVAVLPLRSVGTDEDNQIFTEGITAELLGKISAVRELSVIDGSSFMRYKGTGKDDREIGEALQVEALLKGSVFRAGTQVRILLQLVDTRSQAILKAFEFERQLQDAAQIFAIAREAANGIAGALQVELGAEERQQLAKASTVSLEVYDLYTRGRYLWERRTAESLQKAVEYFSQAVAKDPNFALGYAGLADCYVVRSHYDGSSQHEGARRAIEAAKKAILLDPRLAQPHAALGWVKTTYEWDWAGAEVEFQEAIRLDPGYSVAFGWYALYLGSQGRFDEAVERARQALRLAPDSPLINTILANVLLSARNFREAETQVISTLQLEPNFAYARQVYGNILLFQGRYAEALEQHRQGQRLSGHAAPFTAEVARATALAGNTSEARELLEQLELYSSQRPDLMYIIGTVALALGEQDRALFALEKAVEAKCYGMFNLNVDPGWDRLRPDPRFQRILRTVRLR